jgi:hypothetical protein
MEVSSPTVLPVAGVQAPLRRRPRIFHVRRAEGMIPAPGRRSAFETVPIPDRFALHFTFRTGLRIRTANLPDLSGTPLPLG